MFYIFLTHSEVMLKNYRTKLTLILYTRYLSTICTVHLTFFIGGIVLLEILKDNCLLPIPLTIFWYILQFNVFLSIYLLFTVKFPVRPCSAIDFFILKND